MSEETIIPPITDPMGQYWRQPSPSSILIDDKHALMSKETFESLSDYSCSEPSGVYPGKMWRSNSGQFHKHHENAWFLKWFGEHPDPKFVSNHTRRILIA